jgi:exosortase
MTAHPEAAAAPAPRAMATPSSAVPARWPFVAFLVGIWAWAIAGCTDDWTHNPLYSYGWFVPFLMLFFAWRRIDEPPPGRVPYEAGLPPAGARAVTVVLLLAAALVLPLEWLRQEVPDDRFNNWVIALMAVGFTLWSAAWFGGRALRVSLLFPVLFFLSAVPWPKRWETPVTVGLQGFVAAVILEVLHVMGIYAQPQGNTIYLRNGPVGVAEACSGVRSLQASLMISLAIGELFFLRWWKRGLLIVIAAAIAMLLNLGRTLALCLLAEYQGQEGMDKWHDTIGNVILLGLPLVIFCVGWLLTPRTPKPPGPAAPRPAAGDVLRAFLAHVRAADWPRLPRFGAPLAVGVVGVLVYHGWLLTLNVIEPPQREPFFVARTGPDTDTAAQPVEKAIWDVLQPTSGGYLVHTNAAALGGAVTSYHFFWKPDAANRWVTGHRPDVCMPAGGWKPEGEPFPVTVEINGHPLQFTAFRFASTGARALQLWGQWRNGEPLKMKFFEDFSLTWSFFQGKNRSAVETVSVIVYYEDGEPPMELAEQTLRKIFAYHPTTGRAARNPPLASVAAP